MKRRKFFHTTSCGLAGVALASCTPTANNNSSTGANTTGAEGIKEKPAYRNNTKLYAGNNKKSANDTLVVALIGAGGYGSFLIGEVMKLKKNVKVKYICDVDDTRGGRAMVVVEEEQGFKPIRTRDMRTVFDDKEVDAVFITTPQHWHALATIWACQAGKDVYVEKCISYNVEEGQKMIEAAQKYERIVQCGTQNRSADFALSAKEYIESGELGDLISVHLRQLEPGPIPFNVKEDSSVPDTIDWDMWLGPAPKVSYSISRNKSWGYYWDYSGGLVMSNGIIHQLDMTRLILGNPGFPKSVYCTGGRYFFDDGRDIPDYQMTTFDYGNHVMTFETGECAPYMKKTSTAIRLGDDFPEWKQNASAVQILGTKRMMYVGRMGGGWQVLDKEGEIVAQQSGKFPLENHLGNFIDCVRSRKQPNADIIEGHKSATLVHLANISYRSGSKQLEFDPETETITNNSDAQAMMSRDYRKGFEVPKEV